MEITLSDISRLLDEKIGDLDERVGKIVDERVGKIIDERVGKMIDERVGKIIDEKVGKMIDERLEKNNEVLMQKMRVEMHQIVSEELEPVKQDLARIERKLDQAVLDIGDQITEAAEKTVDLVSDHFNSKVSEIETVTADNCYNITLLKRRA